MIFYAADPHFGYPAILEHTGRPFSCVEEMDEAIISNWNAVVSETDTVYLLGDVGSHFSPFPSRQLSMLKGHKHLIRGNHDACFENQQLFFDYFESVTDFLEIDDSGHHITLCHYPIVYIQSGYMVHGHIHNVKKEIYEILSKLPRVMNACMDVNSFHPVTLLELISNNQIYYNDSKRGTEIKHSRTKGQSWDAVFHPLPHKP